MSERSGTRERSKRTSERGERTSERTSEWPSTYVWILDYFGPQCIPLSFPSPIGTIRFHGLQRLFGRLILDAVALGFDELLQLRLQVSLDEARQSMGVDDAFCQLVDS